MKTRMTPEEKAKRKQEAAARKKREAEEFPAAVYRSRDIQIIFEAGQPYGFTIRTDNLKQFRPSRNGGDAGWVEATVSLRNIESVASLAAALVMRLNGLIREANDDLAKATPISLHQVNPGKQR